MLQALQENDQEWDSQIAERRLNLVNEDIEATKKQILSLENQKSNLKKKCEDLEFCLEEIRSNIEFLKAENITETGDSTEEVEGDFFSLLSELESEEAALKGELQSYQELQRTLSHDRRKYSQTNSQIQKELEFDKQKLENLNNELREANDSLKDLQVQLDAKSNHLNEVIQQCTDLQDEEIAISEELKKHGESIITDLKKEEGILREELLEAQKQEEELTKKYAASQRVNQKKIDGLTNILNAKNSISSWRNDRSLLSGKLRKAKTQLATEVQNLKNAKKRQENLEKEFKEMLGDEDPGDGTGNRAKMMVNAEIDSLQSENKIPDREEERKIENDLNQDLHKQLEMLEKSFEIFNQHRMETLDALNEELENSQDGYLKLLQDELNELQASVSRH